MSGDSHRASPCRFCNVCTVCFPHTHSSDETRS
jgi:hypothetical protein